MAVSSLRKPFYRMEEICRRWGMTLVDLEAFVFAGDLTLSVQVVDLEIEQGLIEPSPDGSLCHLPQGTKYVTGLLDLRGADASRVLRRGEDAVRQFAVKQGEYVHVAPPGAEWSYLNVERKDLVVRHAERERFEAAHQLAQPTIRELPARPRGAQPIHDWDAFWIETCRLLFFDGVPPSQAALIRHVQAWFAAQGKKVPDESTLKRKLKPLWDMVAPEARRAAS
ncbi:hypothetical protein FK498_16455 [Elioraea sp. Yellowstone]|nr:hypothetical protein FK498_16455 [Elioraea sp. Yellowstone]